MVRKLVTRPRLRGAGWLGLALLASACSIPLSVPGGRAPLSLRTEAANGDPARRASTRLVLQGIDADSAGRSGEAVSQYERALQVDPNNPYAWLALGRHEVEQGDPRSAEAFLDKAEALLGPDAAADAARVHVAGLRGLAYQAEGRSAEADVLLQQARTANPAIWADGRLDAAELR